MSAELAYLFVVLLALAWPVVLLVLAIPIAFVLAVIREILRRIAIPKR